MGEGFRRTPKGAHASPTRRPSSSICPANDRGCFFRLHLMGEGRRGWKGELGRFPLPSWGAGDAGGGGAERSRSPEGGAVLRDD